MQKSLIFIGLSLFFFQNSYSFADSNLSNPSDTNQKTDTNIEKTAEVKEDEKVHPPLKKSSKKTFTPIISEEDIKKPFIDSSNDQKFKASTPLNKNLATIEDADLTFSFMITINSDTSIKTSIILQPFVIEPDGHVREFGKYTDLIEEGLNTRFIHIPIPLENPFKGNYVVGYLASFKDPVEATVSFSGEVKGALSRPIKDNGEIARKVSVFVSEQAPVNGPSGREIISVSSDLEIF